ncbi:hypothetical protein PI95_033955 [Hassallia byssoidea VB512170]|uniref:DNA (cytosine-5-)-methyltransferase n=1 Tax=Hassallia byssoidea VB512170 TaxID=1304833 RepID=A0A846HN58_9CYAN|nr:hypothetical protein [Hassalia byssoidea VB512170]
MHSDITNFNAFSYDGAFDIITGGVPCPPFSRQGKHLGPTDNRNRRSDFLRVVAGCRPRWVIIENVPGLLDASATLILDKCGQPTSVKCRGELRIYKTRLSTFVYGKTLPRSRRTKRFIL